MDFSNMSLEEIEEENRRREAMREKARETQEPEEKKAAAILRATAQDAIDRAEAEYGPLGVGYLTVEAPGFFGVFRRPSSGVWKRFQDSKAKADDMIKFVTGCRLYPDARELSKAMDRFAGLHVRIGDLLLDLGRGTAEARGGK